MWYMCSSQHVSVHNVRKMAIIMVVPHSVPGFRARCLWHWFKIFVWFFIGEAWVVNGGCYIQLELLLEASSHGESCCLVFTKEKGRDGRVPAFRVLTFSLSFQLVIICMEHFWEFFFGENSMPKSKKPFLISFGAKMIKPFFFA